MRQRIEEIASRFREKGATTPEKAMTTQELGLPPRFEQAMQRRLGETGIFVDVGGKYYLNEARLGQIEQQRGMGDGGGRRNYGARRNMMTLRIVRMVIGALAILTLLINIFERNIYLWYLLIGLVVSWIVVSILQILTRARTRRGSSGYSGGSWSNQQQP